jgi:Zn ribbon nucleic-acid-binding protein
MLNIEPCPFCGAVDGFAFAAVHYKWGHVECVGCGATGPPVHTNFEPSDLWQDKAISAWNQRKEPKLWIR